MRFHDILKAIENALHPLVHEVDDIIEPGIAYLKANVPAAAIGLGEALLAGAVGGEPWGTLIAALIQQAEAQGIKLAEQAAKVALNTAQTNLIAKGVPSVAGAGTV